MENNSFLLQAKGLLLALLTYAGIPVDIMVILLAVSAFDTAASATFHLRMGSFDLKELMFGVWVKILLLGAVFLATLAAKILGYESAIYISDAFITIMTVQEFFSGITHLRSIKARKKLKQLDLLDMFFSTVKKMILSNFKKWSVEQTDTNDDPEGDRSNP